jgi:hypothetical protein
MILSRPLTVVLIFSLLLSAYTCRNCGHFDGDECGADDCASVHDESDCGAKSLSKCCPFTATVTTVSKVQHPDTPTFDYDLNAVIISFCSADFITLPFEFRCFNSVHPPPILLYPILRC